VSSTSPLTGRREPDWIGLVSSARGLPGQDQNIGSGWGRVLVAGVQRKAGSSGEGTGSKRMMGNGVRVSSMGTDVRGISGPNRGSLLDASALLTHLSLSLSLSAAAEKRLCCADSELLAPSGRSPWGGPSRAPACGPPAARAPRGRFFLSSRLAGVCSSVTCPSPTGLWCSRRPRRVLQHAPVVVRAERRGPTDPGSRRSPIYVSCLGGGR
jgi:hypothetical protein